LSTPAAPSTSEPSERTGWWARSSSWTRFQTIALAVVIVGHVALQLIFLHWYLEDSAICFSFAKHLAHGEGLVAYPGGERVQGYSDPLWVFLLTIWELFRVDGFTSSKIMGGALGAGTVWLSYGITKMIRQKDDIVPLLAAILLAVNPQFVIWNASGLENPLFCFMLALGVFLTLRELRDGGWPWSALAFLGLTLTRPEGLLYAAFGGFWAMVFTLRAGRGVRPTLKWLATFFVPFTVYQVARYEYFAWPFPNTYYSKMGRDPSRPFDFNGRGWGYLRRWAEQLWQGWFLPIYVYAMTGMRKARGWLGMLLVLMVVWAVLFPGPDVLRHLHWWHALPVPSGWPEKRTWLLTAVAVLTPLVALGRRGDAGLLLNWSMLVSGVAFTLLANGDWSKGYRWLSLIAVPESILFAIGIAQAADAVAALWKPREGARKARWLFGTAMSAGWSVPAGVPALLLFGVAIPPLVMDMNHFANRPETTPFAIQRRVNYMHYVQHRLHLDHVVNLDVDMGGTMWWSGDEIVDIAGLVDVPMGHHNYQHPFIREYIFRERRPDFAHLHAGWENTMGVKALPEYSKTYFEIPGYPTGRTALHLGNRVRMDHFVTDHWDALPSHQVDFEQDIRLRGIDAPLHEAGVGRTLYVELAWSAKALPRDPGFRVIGFVRKGDVVKSWDLAPGYDWYTVDLWKPDQIVHSGYSVNIPADLPPGDYDLGIVMFGRDGKVVPPVSVPEGAEGGADDPNPAMAHGEVRWPGLVRILSKQDDAAHLTADRAQLEQDAKALKCDEAEHDWTVLRWRRSWAWGWQGRTRPQIAHSLGLCWLGRGEQATDRDERVEDLARARWWDEWTPGLQKAADPLADTLIAEGRAAMAKENWELAYRRFTDALNIDATRSWARRWAEDARDHRLGLDPESMRKKKEKALEAAKVRAAREQKPPKAEQRPHGPPVRRPPGWGAPRRAHRP